MTWSSVNVILDVVPSILRKTRERSPVDERPGGATARHRRKGVTVDLMGSLLLRAYRCRYGKSFMICASAFVSRLSQSAICFPVSLEVDMPSLASRPSGLQLMVEVIFQPVMAMSASV